MEENSRVLRPGQIYRHFKGNLYQIITVARHSETGEELVIYQKLYDDFRAHARPFSMFMSEVDHEKYPDVLQKFRFELIQESANWRTDLVGKNDGKTEEPRHSEKQPLEIKSDFSMEIAKKNKPEENGQSINPYLIKFLDADTYEEKKNVLVSMKAHITDRLIDDIAAALDVTVDDGELEKRYISLMNCIETRRKFECNRFR